MGRPSVFLKKSSTSFGTRPKSISSRAGAGALLVAGWVTFPDSFGSSSGDASLIFAEAGGAKSYAPLAAGVSAGALRSSQRGGAGAKRIGTGPLVAK